MAWARFLARFDFSPKARGGRVTIVYRPSAVANVTRECLVEALAKGRAVRLMKRSKFAEPVEVQDG